MRFDTKRKSGGKPPQIRPSPKQNRSESQCSCIFQEPMNRGKYAYMGSWVKYAPEKAYCVSKITPVRSKTRRISVSVFLSTLKLTALLLKSFRLLLHCYNLKVVISKFERFLMSGLLLNNLSATQYKYIWIYGHTYVRIYICLCTCIYQYKYM